MDPVGYAASSTVKTKVLKLVSTETAQTRSLSSVSQRCSRSLSEDSFLETQNATQ